jgi:hypothetical protein
LQKQQLLQFKFNIKSISGLTPNAELKAETEAQLMTSKIMFSDKPSKKIMALLGELQLKVEGCIKLRLRKYQ